MCPGARKPVVSCVRDDRFALGTRIWSTILPESQHAPGSYEGALALSFRRLLTFSLACLQGDEARPLERASVSALNRRSAPSTGIRKFQRGLPIDNVDATMLPL